MMCDAPINPLSMRSLSSCEDEDIESGKFNVNPCMSLLGLRSELKDGLPIGMGIERLGSVEVPEIILMVGNGV